MVNENRTHNTLQHVAAHTQHVHRLVWPEEDADAPAAVVASVISSIPSFGSLLEILEYFTAFV